MHGAAHRTAAHQFFDRLPIYILDTDPPLRTRARGTLLPCTLLLVICYRACPFVYTATRHLPCTACCASFRCTARATLRFGLPARTPFTRTHLTHRAACLFMECQPLDPRASHITTWTPCLTHTLRPHLTGLTRHTQDWIGAPPSPGSDHHRLRCTLRAWPHAAHCALLRMDAGLPRYCTPLHSTLLRISHSRTACASILTLHGCTGPSGGDPFASRWILCSTAPRGLQGCLTHHAAAYHAVPLEGLITRHLPRTTRLLRTLPRRSACARAPHCASTTLRILHCLPGTLPRLFTHRCARCRTFISAPHTAARASDVAPHLPAVHGSAHTTHWTLQFAYDATAHSPASTAFTHRTPWTIFARHIYYLPHMDGRVHLPLHACASEGFTGCLQHAWMPHALPASLPYSLSPYRTTKTNAADWITAHTHTPAPLTADHCTHSLHLIRGLTDHTFRALTVTCSFSPHCILDRTCARASTRCGTSFVTPPTHFTLSFRHLLPTRTCGCTSPRARTPPPHLLRHTIRLMHWFLHTSLHVGLLTCFATCCVFTLLFRTWTAALASRAHAYTLFACHLPTVSRHIGMSATHCTFQFCSWRTSPQLARGDRLCSSRICVICCRYAVCAASPAHLLHAFIRHPRYARARHTAGGLAI